ncbi:hemin uptake protein HemP [Cognatishimia sp. F0-27]|uniref:hemin uptake protein HemP n=1 Tax=Cognatishimia sp. F0-27 TaxID=2816855 RepID=UPI001D0C0390|nr:hemin uptake protein HemP [Cognatishimia sp. F0-27]MCC1493100.1 hemin uptake protein HemP [Cognatishimia sp. F0-27]
MTEEPERGTTPEEGEPETLDARTLIRSGNCVRIVLDQQVYVLRITRGGKLILTK